MNVPLSLNRNNQQKSYFSNHRFSPLEDQKLQELVGQFGAKRWRRIAQYMPGRTARQCRDRYSNYLNPEFYNDKWTNEDDMLLIQKFREYGSQWTKITHFFPGKNANNIKNRWNYSVSRMTSSLDAKTLKGPLKQTQNQQKNVNEQKNNINVEIDNNVIIPADLCSLSQSNKKNFEGNMSTNQYEQKPKKLKPFPPISTFLDAVLIKD